MPLSPSDIGFVLSGGSNNNNPLLSLGGDPSSFSLTLGKDRLFESLESFELDFGRTDYRCIYVFNNNTHATFFGVAFKITSKYPNISNTEIGFHLQNDIQRIVLNGTPTSGNFTLRYVGRETTNTALVHFTSDTNQLAANISSSLIANTPLQNVLVTTVRNQNPLTYDVTFTGPDGNRFQELFQVTNNSLNGSTQITVTKVQDGSPINIIIPEVVNSLTAPTATTFVGMNSFIVGDLGPGEGMPIWFKRTVARGAPPTSNDGFNLNMSGNISP